MVPGDEIGSRAVAPGFAGTLTLGSTTTPPPGAQTPGGKLPFSPGGASPMVRADGPERRPQEEVRMSRVVPFAAVLLVPAALVAAPAPMPPSTQGKPLTDSQRAEADIFAPVLLGATNQIVEHY